MNRPEDRARKGPQPMSNLSDILPAVGRELGLDNKVRELAVLALWEQVAPETCRRASRAIRLRQEGRRWIMDVHVADGPTASELAFHLEDIRRRINGFSVQTGFEIAKIDLGIR